MDIRNILKINGDNNISLQNVTAEKILIYSGQESNPEIKEYKKKIADEIVSILKVIATKLNQNESKGENSFLKLEKFSKIDFDELIQSIKHQNCILFIGPEISVDEDGISLHQKFFKDISSDRRRFNEKEGFFMPGSETRIINAAKEYYNNQFPSENRVAYEALKMLAQIPFSLIISLTPDDTMHQIFSDYKIKHQFLYYNGTKHDNLNISDKGTVLYNALGAATIDGRYIYTHKQFKNYFKNDIEAKFPLDIENKIKEENTTHYLFIGFDFDKWYNKLIMYELNLLSEVESFAFDANKTELINQDFIRQEFNVTFIDADYSVFITSLLDECQKKGLAKPLRELLKESLLEELESIRIKTIDCNTFEQLIDLEQKLNSILRKINNI